MEFEKEMTAPVVSVGADTEQSSQTFTDNSLTDFDPDFKGSDDDLYREIQRRMAPDYLETVSMTTLYDTDFEGQEPLIDGLLYRGAYLLAGSPKVGKSFLMAQLAYQVSTGLPLWAIRCGKRAFFTLRWKIIMPAYSGDYSECSVLRLRKICILPPIAKQPAAVWRIRFAALCGNIPTPA